MVCNRRVDSNLMFTRLSGCGGPSNFGRSPVVRCSALFGACGFGVCTTFVTNDTPRRSGNCLFCCGAPGFPAGRGFSTFVTTVSREGLCSANIDMSCASGLVALSAYDCRFSGTELIIINELLHSNRDRGMSASLIAIGRGPHCPRM